jgi:SAM-dependent methyltransferase
MGSTPLSDPISRQYADWMYPRPIMDLSVWVVDNWEWYDPSHAHKLFWPAVSPDPKLDILVAGCGTNQAAIFAYRNPEARIVAVDVSQPSLDHHMFLKKTYGLANLDLHLLPIEDVGSLGLTFDLVVSTGVLHHLADPARGLAAIATCLRKDGVVALMLYAKYGRMGVEMMQWLFRSMGLRQDRSSIPLMQQALAALPSDHPVRAYEAIAPDLQYDAGLIDTFLNARDRSYTITECIDLVRNSGLVFQDLFFKAPYSLPPVRENAFMTSVATLSEEKQWAIMERINFRNACHFFTACRPDRDRNSYNIDLRADRVLRYVPSFRHRCGLTGRELYRPGQRIPLDPLSARIAKFIDGKRSVREIALEISATKPGRKGSVDSESFTLEIIKTFFLLDFVALGWV